MTIYTLKTVSKHSRITSGIRGFTLIEVMVSISIIAIIFLSLFKMQSSTIELAAGIKFNSIAPILAEQLIIRIEQDVANWTEVKGNFGENFEGMEWTCNISEESFAGAEFIGEETHRKFIKFDITITGLSGSQSFKISTWRLADEQANL